MKLLIFYFVVMPLFCAFVVITGIPMVIWASVVYTVDEIKDRAG